MALCVGIIYLGYTIITIQLCPFERWVYPVGIYIVVVIIILQITIPLLNIINEINR